MHVSPTISQQLVIKDGAGDEDTIVESLEIEANLTNALDQSEFIVGLFAIDLDTISLESLKRMRYLLPKDDYRKVKDRKSARLIRRQRTKKIRKLQKKNDNLMEENERLRQMLMTQ